MPDFEPIKVIDVFAGPGGLGEGFSSFEDAGIRPFRIGLSIEKDPIARETLRLRSFFRQFPKEKVPDLYYETLREEGGWRKLPSQLSGYKSLAEVWQRADDEAMLAELGLESHGLVGKRIQEVLGPKRQRGPWVLIGGPPCQAYSLVGRSRNKGVKNYSIESDGRSKLYEQYLRIIAEHEPTIFVMENVTGMLSATIHEKKIFETILADLQSPAGRMERLRYQVVPIVSCERNKYAKDDPRKFIVRCEEYGVPQQRHRVILIGIRENLEWDAIRPLERADAPSVKSMIGSLPRVRSGLSRKREGAKYVKLNDNADEWRRLICKQFSKNGNGQKAGWLFDVEERLRKQNRWSQCCQANSGDSKNRTND